MTSDHMQCSRPHNFKTRPRRSSCCFLFCAERPLPPQCCIAKVARAPAHGCAQPPLFFYLSKATQHTPSRVGEAPEGKKERLVRVVDSVDDWTNQRALVSRSRRLEALASGVGAGERLLPAPTLPPGSPDPEPEAAARRRRATASTRPPSSPHSLCDATRNLRSPSVIRVQWKQCLCHSLYPRHLDPWRTTMRPVRTQSNSFSRSASQFHEKAPRSAARPYPSLATHASDPIARSLTPATIAELPASPRWPHRRRADSSLRIRGREGCSRPRAPDRPQLARR